VADAAVVALNIGAAAVRGLTGEIGHTRSFRLFFELSPSAQIHGLTIASECANLSVVSEHWLPGA